ncbi:hypothetical protein HDU79_000005 [Rhizoclosmatium sp. JEL0117]|nr:hypothetical protein HDU79_000005 [Rhizoclosmatium sp. JEL0117]
MQQVSPSPSRANKAAAIQNEVNEVIGVMQNNIEKAVKRGENLESLQNKTSDLRDGAVKFKKGAVKIQNEMNLKLQLIIAAIVISIVGVVGYAIYTQVPH